MALDYRVDHARRRIHVTASGTVRREDIAQSVSDRVTLKGIDYDTIWDLRIAHWDVRNEELKSIAQDYRAALGSRTSGRLVLVAPDDLTFATLRQQEAILRTFGREMMVCRSVQEAEAWLDEERRAGP